MDAQKNLVLEPGKPFRSLMVHSLLGSGAMGSAYLASHPVLQIPLVIKTFKTFVDRDIFREAYLAARVTSPYTISVLDAGYEEGCPFVVLSYVDGIDLQELQSRMSHARRTIPVDLVVRLIMNACQGFHAIHQAGVIHRDVKPANLFLRGNGTATVGDFGIAISANPSGPLVTVGSPPYMAPEQWLNTNLDRRLDIYSLGATAHLLMTGGHPFLGQDTNEMKTAHLRRTYIPPATRDPREAYLFTVIARMLSKEPEKRYQTAAAVADALEPISQPVAEYTCVSEDSFRVGNINLKLLVGDMTKMETDVIVNAANTHMTMDIGLAAALRAVGGETIAKEALAFAPTRMGDVLWTSAGQLKAKWVAHAVSALGGAICLQRCTLRVLLEAESRHLKSVAFPALGTGVGKVPMELAAQLMLEAIRTFSELKPMSVQSIAFVLRDESAYDCWLDNINAM
jgi:O-acetyl-ADP-ribose deacetylase (regulator of RNase III)